MFEGLHGERGSQLILCGYKELNYEVSQNWISIQSVKILSNSQSSLKLNGQPNVAMNSTTPVPGIQEMS